jgi:outer membrane protein assembly factor BamB
MKHAMFFCLWALLPVLAQAQTNTWSVSLVDGSAVMGETATLTLEARNGAGSPRKLNEVVFAFPAGYVPIGGEGPQRWSVSKLDTANRVIAFWLDGQPCGTNYLGLNPGESARFKVRVVAPQGNGDTQDALVGGPSWATPYTTTQGWDVCRGNRFAFDPTGVRWLRRGLSAQLEATPRTLQPGEDLTLRLTITNRSLQEQSGISLSGPVVVGSTTFDVVSAFAPAALRLASGASGTFTGMLRARSSGTATFQASASNTTTSAVSSPVVSSLEVSASSFAALGDLSPLDLISNETVTVRLNVSNPSTTAYLDIRPRLPLLQGAVTATMMSGPTPASLTSLSPGASASFSWQYRITGTVGTTFRFLVQADATVNGAPLSTNAVSTPQGYVAEHRVRVNPLALRGGATSQVVRYTVYNGGSIAIREVKLRTPSSALFTVSGTPFASDTSGWTPSIVTGANGGYVWTAPSSAAWLQPGQLRVFSLDYASVSTVSRDTVSTHSMELDQGPNWQDPIVDAAVTVLVPRPIPEVKELVAVAGSERNTLLWTNPAGHDGVLILRSVGAPPDQAPIHGRRYTPGEVLGNATVLYSDERSVVSSLADTELSNGTVYYYRVFNHDELYQYSTGYVLGTQGLKTVPMAPGSGRPLWCYSVGQPALLQPVTDRGIGIFSANDSGTVTANLTDTANPLLDGSERWRPVRLEGAVKARFPIVPLHGLSGQYIFTGDQAGHTSAIRAETGQLLWRSTESLGSIQSFPVLQLYDFANAAYRAAHPSRDLVFMSTRLEAGNRVVALNARTGERVWEYAPGDLGPVSGGGLVDYGTNRLLVGAGSQGGILASLRVLDSLTGAELARLSLGDIDSSISRLGNVAIVTSSDGMVYGVDIPGMREVWRVQVATRPAPGVAAFSSFVRPVTGGFLASVVGASPSEGRVERWSISGTAVTRLWSTPVPGPSGAFAIALGGVTRVYVGGSDERVHELDFTTGVDGRQVLLPGVGAFGTPTVDSAVNRLHVGTQDGRICAFTAPF